MSRVTGVVAAVAALLTALLAPLSTYAVEGPGALTLAMLAVAVAALVRADRQAVAHARATVRGVTPHGRRVVPVPATRVTDPVHHPLRPRAPGIA